MAWNKKHRFFNYFFLLLLQVASCIWAQAQEEKSRPSWSTNEWEELTDGMNYNEEKKEEVKKEEIKPLEYKPPTHWLSNFFTSTIGKVVSIVLIFSILVFILLKLLSDPSKNKDRKLKEGLQFSLEDIEENLDESDLERFLRKSLEAGDYKIAVRILYLSLIQQLHQRRWIEWKKDKTNRDFLKEMRSRENYADFRDLTLAFEIVWYGDTDVSHKDFEMLKRHFDLYNNKINRGAKK